MSAPPYMRFYWGDYFKDTRRLNRLEHSAYLLLLGEMWIQGGKLPDDDAELAAMALCTAEEWAEVRPAVMRFFRSSRGKLTQKRLAEEMAKYSDTVRKRKTAGKAGASATNGKRKENSAANAEQTPTEPEPEPEPERKREEGLFSETDLEAMPAVRADGAKARGSRIKPDWRPSADNIAYAMTEGFSQSATERMADAFRDYWTAATGQKATKLDWSAAWRTWVRNQRDRGPPRGPNGSSQRVGFV